MKMNPFRAVVAQCLCVVWTLLLTTSSCQGWLPSGTIIHMQRVTPSSFSGTNAVRRTTTTTTRLGMFDWFQKSKARKSKQSNEEDTTTQPRDFLTEFFDSMSSHDDKTVVHEETHQQQDHNDDNKETESTSQTPEDKDGSSLPFEVIDESSTGGTTTPTTANTATTTTNSEETDDSMAARTSAVIEKDTTTTNTSIHKGKVQWFSPKKGYGFLVKDGAAGKINHYDNDIFVHHSAIVDPDNCWFRKLQADEPVEFQMETDHNGRLKAVQVTGPNATPVQAIREQQDRHKSQGSQQQAGQQQQQQQQQQIMEDKHE